MKVTWSDRSLRSLADIHTRISEDSEPKAHRTVDRILRRGDQLAHFPNSGRLVPDYNRPEIRELIEKPYRILYRIQDDGVQIVDVFHSARRPPWER